MKKLIVDLNPAGYNPRVMTARAFEGLKESLKEFGLVEPVVINEDNTIIGGHMRVEAARQLGWKEVDVTQVNLDKIKEKKLNVILNSQAISGTYDDIKLAEILEELKLEPNYEALMLDQIKPLDLSPREDGENDQKEYIRYEILFDDESQQQAWFKFIGSLKRKPENEGLSIAAMLVNYIEANG